MKEKKVLVIETQREGYAPAQCRETLTAGEIRNILNGYDDETPVYSFLGDGYTYGSIHLNSFKLVE